MTEFAVDSTTLTVTPKASGLAVSGIVPFWNFGPAAVRLTRLESDVEITVGGVSHAGGSFEGKLPEALPPGGQIRMKFDSTIGGDLLDPLQPATIDIVITAHWLEDAPAEQRFHLRAVTQGSGAVETVAAKAVT